MQPQMFYGPGQQPPFMGPGARGQMPFPQALGGVQGGRGGYPSGLPPQQGGRGVAGAAQQVNPAMYGLPPNMPPGSFPPGAYGNPAYLQQLAQAAAAQQAAMTGRGGGARGAGAGLPGMTPNMPMNAIRSNAMNPGLGRGALPIRQGQMMAQGRGMPNQGGQMPPVPSTSGIDMVALNAAPPSQQKQILGEALYPKIHDQQPELAGKITGMLLEMENNELLSLYVLSEARDAIIEISNLS